MVLNSFCLHLWADEKKIPTKTVFVRVSEDKNSKKDEIIHSGQVFIVRNNDTPTLSLTKYEKIFEKDAVFTKNGRAQLTIVDGSVVTLSENSSVVFEKYKIGVKDLFSPLKRQINVDETHLAYEKGSIRFQFLAEENAIPLLVKTNSVFIRPVTSVDFFILKTEDPKKILIGVLKGAIEVRTLMNNELVKIYESEAYYFKSSGSQPPKLNLSEKEKMTLTQKTFQVLGDY